VQNLLSPSFLFKNIYIKIYRTIILPLFCMGVKLCHWGDPDVDGRIILRGIFRKWEGVVGTGWSGLRIGSGGGLL
jgi:hypothetical protein